MEGSKGRGWLPRAVPIGQAGGVLVPELVVEKGTVGRVSRVIVCGFGLTGGVTVIVGSSEETLAKGIGMPLGLAYLYLELEADEELRLAAFSALGGGTQPVHIRTEVFDARRG